jgi:protein involved in polysaccharide export with SLBB domain
MTAYKSTIRFLAHLFCTGLCVTTLAAHAQLPMKQTEDTVDTSLSSSAINAGPTGVTQATNLARPTDTLSTITRDIGKVGGDTASAGQTADDLNRSLARSRGPARADPPSQFQRFVQESTGKMLLHFGAQLFDAPQNYVPDAGLAVPANYILGPGDEIRLQVWGAVDFSATLPIDRSGQVTVPKVGVVPLAGVAMRDLEPVLRSHLAKVFTNFSLNANLGRLRSIQVYVVGQARQPGTYAVSSLSTLVNALFVSGGPGANGTMRRIQLQRAGKVVTEFDLYDFIAKGDKSKDSSLLPGDVIFVPAAGPRVAVTGALDQPAIYELLDNKNKLGDILGLNGALPSMANTQKALLERIDPSKLPARQVVDIALDAKGLAQPLRDGDVLTLLPVDRSFANAVTLRGNVANPMRYSFREGMRVSDLIPEPSALVQRDYYTRKNAMVQFESGKVVSDARVINEVKNLLEEINWDYAAIERMDAKEVRTVLIPFNLGKAVKAKDPANDIVLQSGDIVTIFGVNDLAVPLEKRTQFVRVSGEVMVPGIYQIQAGETLPQLIRRVGGYSQNAFPYGLVFSRESTRVQQQANLDKSIRRMEQEVNSQTSTVLQNVVDSANGNSMQAQLAGQKIMLARLQNLRASGRIALELDPTNPVLPAIDLQDGDNIVVPSRPSFVSVFGEVMAENASIHRPNYTVSDYLDKAGMTKDADTDGVMVIRADGSVEGDARRSNWFGSGVMSKRLNPGDTVFVPGIVDRRTAYSKFIEGAKDWTAIFYQFGLGAAGLKTLRN